MKKTSTPSAAKLPGTDIRTIYQGLEQLESKMHLAIQKHAAWIGDLHPDQKISALNLIRYLVLRSEDIRSLQDQLHIAGLSSLTSSESHILRQIQACLERLGKTYSSDEIAACDYYKGREIIRQRSVQLFGQLQDDTIPWIMVTFDTNFADNYKLIRKLLEAGMNVARINCAHDNEETWKSMIDIVHHASAKTGLPCKIYMDIGGPKMRTRILGKGRRKGKIQVSVGETITFAERDAKYNPKETVISCDERNVIKQLKPGERILFDDGMIEAQVMSNRKGVAKLEVIRVSNKKSLLRAQKGINFPDSDIDLPALTKQDRKHIPFIAAHADLLGYSFVRNAAGIAELQKVLDTYERRPHIILKIETPQAVLKFPSLLVQGMQHKVFGVMIARGDLAVEIGFERMSEIQEEILWISEAAHVPVIWATQVLETLNKSGLATRAEVTDASYAAMAECVMINKGDYIIEVLKTLIDIMKRSSSHHTKKRYTFRPMQIARDYFISEENESQKAK
jgi:pyruvate kinase